MSAAQHSADVIRLPVRLRVIPVQSAVKSSIPAKSETALGRPLWAGSIDDRRHAAGLAYAALRHRDN